MLKEVKVLRAGESFGELALLRGKNTPRAATIICKEQTHFAYLEREDFLLILSKLNIILYEGVC